jgi:hypothetical protein
MAMLGRWALVLTGLLAIVGIPTTAILAGLDELPWWSVGIAFGVLVLALAVLRTTARRRAAHRRAAPRRAARTAPAAARVQVTAAQTRTPDVNAVADALPTAAVGPAGTETEASRVAAPAGATAYPHATASAEGQWSPVAVPVPTYLLKDKVERPLPEAADVTPTPAPAQPAAEAQPAADAPEHRAVGS